MGRVEEKERVSKEHSQEAVVGPVRVELATAAVRGHLEDLSCREGEGA